MNEPVVDPEVVFDPDKPNGEPVGEVTDSLQAEAETGEEEAKPEEPEKPAPKPKDAIAKLTGRIGHLTRTSNEKDAALAQARAELEALRAMLPAGTDPANATPPAGSPAEFQKAVEAAAERRLFDAECNRVFEAGVSEHGAEFQQSIANLNSMNLASPALVEASMEAGAPVEILKFLGEDLDEAERIASLSPAKMGVALAKLAASLTESNHSRAPQPIKPIGGAAKNEPDVYDPNITGDEYIARRRKSSDAFWLQ
jgi:hypothetical protein